MGAASDITRRHNLITDSDCLALTIFLKTEINGQPVNGKHHDLLCHRGNDAYIFPFPFHICGTVQSGTEPDQKGDADIWCVCVGRSGNRVESIKRKEGKGPIPT